MMDDDDGSGNWKDVTTQVDIRHIFTSHSKKVCWLSHKPIVWLCVTEYSSQISREKERQNMLEILALSLLLASSNAFQSQSCRIGRPGMKRTTMHFEEALIGNTALTNENLPSCRYIASNRFKVKNNAGPKFEKRWAERKSRFGTKKIIVAFHQNISCCNLRMKIIRLANLNGFRFFSLFKRVQDFDADYSAEGEFGNYISLTV